MRAFEQGEKNESAAQISKIKTNAKNKIDREIETERTITNLDRPTENKRDLDFNLNNEKYSLMFNL